MLRCENGGALHSLGMLACEAATDPLLSVDPSDGQWQLTEILLPPLQPCPRPVLGCC